MKQSWGGVENNICRSCEQPCCKIYPGLAHPTDFFHPLLTSLRIMLKSGEWVIDWLLDEVVIGDPQVKQWDSKKAFFIRPRIKGTTQVFDHTREGECIFLRERIGCIWPLSVRPMQCRMLVPDLKMCDEAISKERMVKAWKPYQKLLLEIGEQL